MKRPKGKDVRALREQMGLTQEEFGHWVYRAPRIVQAWEADTRAIPLDTWEFLNLLHESQAARRWRKKFAKQYGSAWLLRSIG